MLTKTTTISPTPPYNFERTAGFGAIYPATYTQGDKGTPTYERLLNINSNIIFASVRSIGSTSKPKLSLELTGTELNATEITESVAQIEWGTGLRPGSI